VYECVEREGERERGGERERERGRERMNERDITFLQIWLFLLKTTLRQLKETRT
jgi:hypothetical protein